MGVLKVIEILSSSKISWEDATKNAVKECSKSLNHVVSVYVQDFSTTIKDGEVDEFRVNVKLTFKVEK